MSLYLASQEEKNNWNDLVIANPDGGHFLQSIQWGDFKEQWGWQPSRFIFEFDGQKLAIQILKKKTPLGWIWYCPKGPGLISFSHKFWPVLLDSLAKEAKKNNAFLLKIEPEIVETEEEIKKYRSLGLIKSALDLQFKATVFVDLKKTEEEILAGFKQKTRYNIRLAQKRGVSIKKDNSPDGIEKMYRLYAETGTRANFFLRPKEYTLSYWKKCIDANLGKIFIAYEGETPLAGLFAYFLGKKIWYKDGGSSRLRKEIMAPYALQWEAMRWAKNNGYEIYDMVAVPPKSEQNKKNPFEGLYKFKTGFNPEPTEFVGCLDMPINFGKYKLWTKLESSYLKIYRKISKNSFY